MAYEYTTVTVDLTENGSGGATGTIYAELFHTVTLANNDTVAPQVYSATVTAGAATLTLPCTATALMNTNAPFLVTFVPTGGKRRTLGRIITTESASAVQLSDLLEVGGSSAVPVTTYNIEATNLVTASSIANLQAMRNQADGARVLVTDVGIYRYSAASAAIANETRIVTPASAVGRWILEICASDTMPFFDVRDYGVVNDGVTDAYAALQTVVTAVNAAGKGIVYFPPGTYLIDQYRITGGGSQNTVANLTWSNLNGAHFIGHGAKIDVRGNFNRAADSGTTSYSNSVVPFDLQTCQNVVIEGFELDGNVDQMSRGVVVEGGNYGVWMTSCSNITLRDLNTHHWAADGLIVGSGTVATRSVTLENVRSWANARQGMSVLACRGLVARNCRFEDTGLTNAAGTAVGSYTGHAPQAGVDIEPLYNTPTVDIRTGGINFYGCALRNNVGSQINATYAAGDPVTDSILFSGCDIEHGTSTSNYTVILAVALGVLENCHINVKHRGIYAQWVGSLNTYTVVRNCRIIVGNDGATTGNGLNATVNTAAANCRVLAEGNHFIGQMAVTASSFVPYITSSYVIFRNNHVYLPAVAHDGTTFHIACKMTYAVCEGNTYDTSLALGATMGSGGAATASEHFANDYTSAARVSNERYVAGTYFRGVFNGTWDNTLPYGGSSSYGNSNPGRVVFPAGSTAAGSFPAKFITGSLLTTPEAGAVEFNTPKLYFTGSATRRRIAEGLEASATWNPASVAVGASVTTTVAVTGAAMGDYVVASFGVDLSGLVLTGYVSVAGTVTVVLSNPTAGAVDLGSSTLRVFVLAL